MEYHTHMESLVGSTPLQWNIPHTWSHWWVILPHPCNGISHTHGVTGRFHTPAMEYHTHMESLVGSTPLQWNITHTWSHTHMHTYGDTHTHTHTRTHAHMHTHMHMHTHTHAHTHIHTVTGGFNILPTPLQWNT